MNVSADVLQQIFPRARRPWVDAIAELIPGTSIDTPNELASFCATLDIESMGLTVFVENLDYTPQAILKTFNTKVQRFLPEEAERYGRTAQHPANQEMIANIAYANRMGNGPVESGDGWRNRGHGPIQMTGANNLITCGRGINMPVLSKPGLLTEPVPGIKSALWYWKVRNMDLLDDDEDMTAETRGVNGGTHGLAQRQASFNRMLQTIQEVA